MTKKNIKEYYEKYRVPAHIISHMQKVAKVCEELIIKLKKKGITCDEKSIIYAALLHDVLRVCDFRDFSPENLPIKKNEEDMKVWKNLRKKYGKIGHAAAMAQMLKEEGEEKIANLVLKHDFLAIDELKTWEEKIIYYADKRVDGNRIVSLKKD